MFDTTAGDDNMISRASNSMCVPDIPLEPAEIILQSTEDNLSNESTYHLKKFSIPIEPLHLSQDQINSFRQSEKLIFCNKAKKQLFNLNCNGRKGRNPN